MFDVFSQNIEDRIVFLHVFVFNQSIHFFFEIFSCFATIALSVVIELEQFELEPTTLNSNFISCLRNDGEFYF
jgi:hypothetical protein